jgi:hypothetical protein
MPGMKMNSFMFLFSQVSTTLFSIRITFDEELLDKMTDGI